MAQTQIFKNVTYWGRVYAAPGVLDQRAVHAFMDCESTESIAGLRAELLAISKGNFNEQSLDLTVGQGRKLKYRGYAEWAKLMLQWMAGYKGA